MKRLLVVTLLLITGCVSAGGALPKNQETQAPDVLSKQVELALSKLDQSQVEIEQLKGALTKLDLNVQSENQELRKQLSQSHGTATGGFFASNKQETNNIQNDLKSISSIVMWIVIGVGFLVIWQTGKSVLRFLKKERTWQNQNQ